MTYLFFIALAILLIFQYLIVLIVLCHNDQIEFFTEEFELKFYLIPIVPVIVFCLVSIYAIWQEKQFRDDVREQYKKLKKNQNS